MLQQPIYCIFELKISTGMRAMRIKTKHIHPSAADLLNIRVGNLDWDESHEKKN